ncbi:4-alpha-glucanotransferase, partial [Pseudoxanthomonas sp. SGD-10]
YHRLNVKGAYKDQVIAFARRYKSVWYITIVPLALPKVSLINSPDEIDWKDTEVELPAYIPLKIENIFTRKCLDGEGRLLLNDVLYKLPIALLRAERFSGKRGAGVLMHITSLPSSFGIGDLGPQARQFADFLSRNMQKYWQLLPLNPVEEANAYSPYSSCSAMAGNTLLISLDELLKVGLLQQDDIELYKLTESDQVDYLQAKQIKTKLLDKAWENFVIKEDAWLNFKNFCKRERHWIDDYALYIILKEDMGGLPWYEWPDEYKFRNGQALVRFEEENEERLNKEKWLQYCFFRQWKALRYYCNAQGIELIGDLPFYVSYDSVDVWANPQIFLLNENLEMAGVAGVPPDYFN